MTPYAYFSSSSTDRVGVIFLISVPTRTELYAASPFFYASRPPSLPCPYSFVPLRSASFPAPDGPLPTPLLRSAFCTGPPTTLPLLTPYGFPLPFGFGYPFSPSFPSFPLMTPYGPNPHLSVTLRVLHETAFLKLLLSIVLLHASSYSLFSTPTVIPYLTSVRSRPELNFESLPLNHNGLTTTPPYGFGRLISFYYGLRVTGCGASLSISTGSGTFRVCFVHSDCCLTIKQKSVSSRYSPAAIWSALPPLLSCWFLQHMP